MLAGDSVLSSTGPDRAMPAVFSASWQCTVEETAPGEGSLAPGEYGGSQNIEHH